MRLFTMETRCHGEDPPSKASVTCEIDNSRHSDGDFRSALYFDLDNKGHSLIPGPKSSEEVNGNDGLYLEDNPQDGGPSPRQNYGHYTPLHAQLLAKQVELRPIQYSETMTVSAVPNYEERYVSTCVNVENKKRFKETVNFEPTLCPVNYAASIICYRNSTRKRFLSTVEYEPRVRPQRFAESQFVYPKSAETTFVSALDYHIDECRRWFKSSVELKAKTYTTSRIQHEKPVPPRYSVTVTKQPTDTTISNGSQEETVFAMPTRSNEYIKGKFINGHSKGYNSVKNGNFKDDNDNYDYEDSEC